MFLVISILLVSACEKEAELTTLQEVNFPSPPEVSSSSLQLLQENANEAALSISWPEVIYPVDAPVDYSVQIDIPADTLGNNAWDNAITLEAGVNVFSKSLLVMDLNEMAKDLGLEVGEEGILVVRVLSYLDRTIASPAVGFTVSPYETVITLPEIFLPGAYQGWDPATAVSIASTETSGIYQGILFFPEGSLNFKITTQRNWEENYGGDGNGNLVFDGPDLSVPALGTYRITVNLNTLTWSAEPYSFGIIGTATAGGWTTDTDMIYDNERQLWIFTGELQAGALKFRLNDSWTVNYGSRNNEDMIAYLDDPGAHTIPQAGMYEVTFKINPEDPTQAFYTVQPISWGIIGTATAGGWDSDTDLTYDMEENIWKITADLVPGALKFRRNDVWTVNYGPRNNEDGILYLDDPGAHNIAEAGTYDITLTINLANRATASYTVQKVN